MKKITYILSLFTVVAFVSCDRIKSPIVKKDKVVGTNFITKNNYTDNTSASKKALLEDYTGMKCPNCYNAITTAKNLANSNPNVIVIAVHAGSFAEPFGAIFTADYRTNAGDVWYGSQGFGIPSNPNGLVNRTNYGSNGLIMNETKWSSAINLAQADQMIVKLNVTTNYDTVVGALNTKVDAIFKKASTDNLKICIALTEDGIIGTQKNMAVDIEDFEFEHVLRGAVNSPWGEDLTTSAKAVNDTVKYSFNDFNLKGMTYTVKKPPAPDYDKAVNVNDKNVSVIVFVYKASTKEILQVEKVKIR